MARQEPTRVLLVYPQHPDTFWSYKYALKFISKKASSPPLGLLTVAAMLPEDWKKRLVDTHITTLEETDIEWADYVFISAMSIQETSARQVVARCKAKGVKTVGGGPLFTSMPDAFPDVDYLVLDEAEITLPLFLKDLAQGRRPRHIYRSAAWADIRLTPNPRWEMIDMKKYASMNIQYSRGCPFNCEFCNITVLYGQKARTKGRAQIIAELDGLYRAGWKGSVFFVDDNFIGNKAKLKREVLPGLVDWMKKRRYPFAFATEVSINLADDRDLMELMVEAGFDTVFVGIETTNETSLAECQKLQNENRDLMACVKTIQRSGLQVQGGFIVGFDNDPPSIFDRLTRFIQESGIVTAMVGLLNAPRGTRLHKRLTKEGRLLKEITGDHMDLSMNFVPKMNPDVLISGYQRILRTIYSPKCYYDRIRRFLSEYAPGRNKMFHFRAGHAIAFLRSVLFLGIIGGERRDYWKLLLWSLFTRPRLVPLAIQLAICGFHFRKVSVERTLRRPDAYLPY
jgi:radical SAM superfamily enzyme YgiQ (UPF0313 family)